MESEWLDLAYINFDKVIMHGRVMQKEQHESFYITGEKQIEQVLTPEQVRLIEDIQIKHRHEMLAVMTGFLSA